MSDTPTPRTDAAIYEIDQAYVGHDGLSSSPYAVVEPDFARQLERELAAVSKERDEAWTTANAHRSTAAQAIIERDQLREECERLKAENERLREDGELLDVIIENRWAVSWNPRHFGFTVQLQDQVCGNIAHGELRDALRAARKTL